MKKFLSLVLALVMTMSLVTVSAGAKSFDDAEDIQYVEAVEVLNLIGVLEGYPDGSFQPKTVLTRAQAATIITKLLLTPEVATELTADAAPFADVPADNWAAAYIAEGVQAGILAGMGDGTFAPNAQLTGFAYLKMLLCALGFDAEAEGMTGANWSINVAKLAKKNGLTEGNDAFVGKNPVTREEAALYTFNAMQKKTVEGYSNDGGVKITVGDVVIESVAGTAEQTGASLLKSTYKDLERETDGEDDFGRAGIYWTYGDEESEVVYAAADYVLVAEEAYESLAAMIEDKELEDEIETVKGFDAAVKAGEVVELWVEDEAVTDRIEYSYAIAEITVEEDEFDDESHEYECGVSAKYELSDYAEKGVVYVDVFEKCDKKNCDECKSYKAIGEWEDETTVMVTLVDGVEVEIAEVETVEGKVKSRNDSSVKVDGEKLTVVKAGFVKTDVNYDDEYTFYLDPNGLVIDFEVAKEGEDEAEKEYVYVLKAQAEYDEGSDGDLFVEDEDATFKAAVKVMWLDGEVEVVDYATFEEDKDDDDEDELYFELFGDDYLAAEDEDELNDVKAGWYAYELEDDAIVLTEKVEGKTLTINDSRKWGELRVDGETEVVLLTKDGLYDTYTGRSEMPEDDMELKNALVIEEKGTVVSVYNYAEKKSAYEKEKVETIDVALFVELGDEFEDGTEATFYVAGEKETYLVEDVEELVKGKLYAIEIDDEIATVEVLTEETEGVVKATVEYIDGEYFEADGVAYEMDEDCSVWQLNNAGDKVSTGKLAKKNVVIIFAVDDDVNVVSEIFQYKGDVLAF